MTTGPVQTERTPAEPAERAPRPRRHGGAWMALAVPLFLAALAGVVLLALSHARELEQRTRARAAMKDVRVVLGSVLYRAEHLFRNERLRDADADGHGEFAPLHELMVADLLDEKDWVSEGRRYARGPYAYRVLVPQAVDAAEQGYVVVAQPLAPGLRFLGGDEDGNVYVAPENFTPDPANPVDVRSWTLWE